LKALISAGGKGGSGKSLSAINIARSLKGLGHKVGLLDLDLDSPNLPAMFGKYGGITQDADRYFVPVIIDGVPVVSIGLMSQTVQCSFKTGEENRQVVKDMVLYSRWGDVEMLVADVPAGFGDELHAFIDTIGKDNMMGAIITVTPSNSDDLKRCIDLMARLKIRILGVIENFRGVMTSCGTDAICQKCGEPVHLFNSNNLIKELTDAAKLKYIMAIPVIEKFFVGQGTYPYLPPSLLETLTKFLKDEGV